MAEAIIDLVNLTKNITSGAKPVHLKVPELGFRVEVPADKGIAEAWKKDPLFRAKMSEAATKIGDSILRQMIMATKGYDAKAEEAKADDVKRKAVLKTYQALVKEQVDLAVRAVERDTAKVFADLASTKKEYSKYKWKAGIKVSLGVAGLITSIAIAASAGASFGATAIPGIIAMVRSAAQIAVQCKALCDELEDTTKQLKSTMGIVVKTYKGLSTAGLAAAEINAMFVQKVLVVELPSIKKCENLLARGRDKTNGVVVKAHDIAKKLEKALLGVDAIMKKADPKAKAKLGKIEGTINTMIISIMAEVKRAEKGKTELDNAAKVVKALVDKKPAFLPYVEKLMIVIDVGFGATSWPDVVQNATAVVAD
ncbi:MAG: hypothetical protein ACKVQR_09790, partial [Aquabacterium sp.]